MASDSTTPAKQSTKRPLWRRLVRWTACIVLAPFVLFFLLAAALYIPFVQDWAVGIACEKISEAINMDVKVKCLRLSFPLDVDLQQLCITEPSDKTDTVCAVNHCLVDLDLTKLLSWRLGVDAIDLQSGKVDSHDIIDQLVLKGDIRSFHVDAHDLEFKKNHVNITQVQLEGCDVDIAMRDTTIVDTTTSEPVMWTLDFSDVSLKNTRVAFHTARNTMSVLAGVKEMTLQDGSFDIGHNKLKLNDLYLDADSLLYDQNYEPHTKGFDYNHLVLHDVKSSLPSLDYDLDAGHLQTTLADLSFREKCGFQLDKLKADVELDTLHLKVRNAELITPSSQLRAWADLDWAALKTGDEKENGGAVGIKGKANKDEGSLHAYLSADFSRDDVMALAGTYLPDNVRRLYPDRMLTAEVEVAGNLKQVDIKSFRVMMPGMLDAKVSGGAGNLIETDHLNANLDWDVRTYDLSLVKRMFNLTGFNLPPMHITGNTDINGQQYKAKLNVQQGKGTLKVDGQFNGNTNAYQARLKANRFVVSRFVPMSSACVVTTQATVKGCGFDMLSPRTRLTALLNVPSARYGKYDISKVHMDAKMAGGKGIMNFYSGGDIVDADGCLEWQLTHNKVDSATFAFDVRGLDFYALGLTKKPLKASMGMHMIGETNLKDRHYVKGNVDAIQLTLEDTTFYPKDITLEALVHPDSTYAFLSAGDLLLHLNSEQGYEEIMKRVQVLSDSLNHQMDTREYNLQNLTHALPTIDLNVQSGMENPFYKILLSQGYSYRELNLDLHTNPESGVNGSGHVYSTNTGSIVLDTIAFVLHQDTTGLNLDARVCNGKRNKDISFNALCKANINPDKIGASLLFYDAKGKKGVDLGGELAFLPEGMRLHLTPLRPILAYRYFTLNDDNFISISKDGRYDADLDLVADDGTGLKLFSTPNDEAVQDLTASLNHFNVGELCSVIPYMPSITGFLHGDVHYVQTDQTTFMADLTVEDMTYEGCQMGDIGVNTVYMPNSDGTHFVDGYLTQNEQQVLSYNGTYANETDAIDATATLERFPVALANGFLGETINLAGNLLGDLHVTGTTSKPRVDGAIVTDSLHVLSPLYSVNMRVQDDSIQVAGSKLNLNKILGYTTGATPLTLDGIIDFSDLSRISLDLTAKAKNFELINAQKNRKAAAYGKVYVDLNARAKGTTNDLAVAGNLGVLGNTDVTYVLMDSPITVEDEMSDLVTFCDFGDTVQTDKDEFVAPSNLSMRFNISIDQAAQVNCLLSEDGVNYVKLEGGGDLVMTYDDIKGMQLFGRYTILDGQMTYTLMVMSLKDCTIANGSYAEFTGDLMNPKLNISASERVRSTITENETPRTVNFDVGLTISQTLNNMGLQFTLDAPEDMTVKNEIAQMTAEQRNRVAVTLMATGMYLVEGQQSGGFSTTNALNSFLQSQIASITGKALNSIDLSLGVQNNQKASGSITTDYSFRFAKRFWGNRISVIVGGKVSSGSEAVNTGQSIIDNVSIEYRLDKSATRYVTVYYDNSDESILEGKITEMGAGLVLRKSTDKLGELFLFRKKEEKTPD